MPRGAYGAVTRSSTSSVAAGCCTLFLRRATRAEASTFFASPLSRSIALWRPTFGRLRPNHCARARACTCQVNGTPVATSRVLRRLRAVLFPFVPSTCSNRGYGWEDRTENFTSMLAGEKRYACAVCVLCQADPSPSCAPSPSSAPR